MKKTITLTLIFLLFGCTTAQVVKGQNNIGARTESQWNVRSGSYLETVAPLGYDILINGTNKYLNFGILSGTSGYGLRDDGGTMEYKNSGGTWAGIGSGVAGGGGGLTHWEISGDNIQNKTATTSDVRVVGDFSTGGDIGASTNGATLASPRVFGYTDLSSGEAARFQFGDEHNGLQNAYASDVELYSYWGLVLSGGRQNYSSGFSAPVFQKTTDTGVLILADNFIGHDPASEGDPITTFAVRATSSDADGIQWTNLFELRESNNDKLTVFDSQGHLTIGSGVTSTDALHVVGNTTLTGSATTTGSQHITGDTFLNASTTAKDIFPETTNTYQLGDTSNTWKNAYFTDENGQMFSMRDIAFEQRNIADDLPYHKIKSSDDVTSGVWTVDMDTDGNDAGENIVLNINRQVYRHTGSNMTVDASAFAGTDASPNNVYIISWQSNGSPTLEATTTDPHSLDWDLEHIDLVTVKAGYLSDGSVTIYGSTFYKTQSYESLAKLIHKQTHPNAPYVSGMGITSASDDVTIASGEAVWMVDDFDTAEKQVTVDSFFYIDSSGNYATSTTIGGATWEFDGNYSTGETIAANKFFNVYLGLVSAAVDNSDARLMALVQRGDILDSEYKDMEDCIADDDGARVTQPTDSILIASWIPVARVCVKQEATNELQEWPSGLYHDDVRIGGQSVGAGGAVTSNFIDDEFTIQDDGDATALMAFQLSGVTTGNTRTVTVQDSDGTMCLLEANQTFTGDLTMGVVNASTTNIDNLTVINATSTNSIAMTSNDGLFSIATSSPWGQMSIEGQGSVPAFVVSDTANNTDLMVDASGVTVANNDINVNNADGSRTNVYQFNGDHLMSASSTLFSLFVGNDAGLYTTSTNNLYVGSLAGDDIYNSGTNNTGIGVATLGENESGSNNVAIGANALDENTTGSNNMAIGATALTENKTGNHNVAIGISALRLNESGSNNVAIGTSALYNNIKIQNVAIGYNASANSTDAYGNIVIGYLAGDSLTTGDANIIIGYQVDAPSATLSEQMTIGNLLFGTGIDGTGTTISSGNIGIATTTPDYKLTVVGQIMASTTADQLLLVNDLTTGAFSTFSVASDGDMTIDLNTANATTTFSDNIIVAGNASTTALCFSDGSGCMTSVPTGSASGARTIVVAASDAADGAGADYTCDGTADEVQINLALAAVKAAGGKVVLTDGNFTLAAPIALIGKDADGIDNPEIMLHGTGIDSTIITSASGNNAINLTQQPKYDIAYLTLAISGAANAIDQQADTERGNWQSHIHDIFIKTDFSTHHTDSWGIYMESPFRMRFNNIEMNGVANGMWLTSHTESFNPGNLSVDRLFIDLWNDAGVADAIGVKLSTTDSESTGHFNLATFNRVDIAGGAALTSSVGIHLVGATADPGGSYYGEVRQNDFNSMNIEDVKTAFKLEAASDNSFENINYTRVLADGKVFDLDDESVNNRFTNTYLDSATAGITVGLINDLGNDTAQPNKFSRITGWSSNTTQIRATTVASTILEHIALTGGDPDIDADLTEKDFKLGNFDLSNATVKTHTYPAFTYTTSTAWSGTTTIPLGIAFNAEQWDAIKCTTDTGTVKISVHDGTNRMNILQASTTVGHFNFSTNNTFTASEKRYADIGHPASTPTSISCTVDKIINN